MNSIMYNKIIVHKVFSGSSAPCGIYVVASNTNIQKIFRSYYYIKTKAESTELLLGM